MIPTVAAMRPRRAASVIQGLATLLSGLVTSDRQPRQVPPYLRRDVGLPPLADNERPGFSH